MSAASDVYQPPKVSFWNDPKIRSILVQVIMLLVVGFFVYEIVDNTITNLTKRNISTGFEFLNKSAGFDLIQSLVVFTSESSYGQALIVGFLNTLAGLEHRHCLRHTSRVHRRHHAAVEKLAGGEHRDALHRSDTQRAAAAADVCLVWRGAEVAAGSTTGHQYQRHVFPVEPRPQHAEHDFWRQRLVGACRIGCSASLAPLSCAAGRASGRPRPGNRSPMSWPELRWYWCCRFSAFLLAGWPITFDYPVLGGFNFSGGTIIIPEFMALLVALSIYTASFIAEIVRAGIQSVSHGQTEAAHALGTAERNHDPAGGHSRRPCG